MSKYIGAQWGETVQNLRLDRHKEIREFLYYGTDSDAGYVFQAYECQQEYNRVV